MYQETSPQKRSGSHKALHVLVAILSMIVVSAVVALAIHELRSSAAEAMGNGLSAYELAQQCGYNGSVEDWLDSLRGKSAYEIAVENGYSGTEKDWSNALAAAAEQPAVRICSAKFSAEGELILVLSDGTELDLGRPAGARPASRKRSPTSRSTSWMARGCCGHWGWARA